MLFVVGAFASMVEPLLAAWQSRALVSYCYLAGGTYFTCGAYLGWFGVINAGIASETRLWAEPQRGTSILAYWGSLAYFLGAACFQVAVLAAVLAPQSRFTLVFLEWAPQALGGLLFTVAAALEILHNRGSSWRDWVWWLCFYYLLGSVLFLFAAANGLAAAAFDWQSSGTLVDLPYLIGSALFYLGAWVQMQMWKADQFGLGFISEVNPDFFRSRQQQQQGEGCGFSWPQAQLIIVTSYAGVSVVNICLAIAWVQHHGLWDGQEVLAHMLEHDGPYLDVEEMLSACTSWVVSHTILLLATVLHATPTIEPFNYLTWLLRVVEALWCLAEILTFLSLMAGDGM